MTAVLRSICTGRVHIKQSTALSFVLSSYVLGLCAEPLLAPTSADASAVQLGPGNLPFRGPPTRVMSNTAECSGTAVSIHSLAHIVVPLDKNQFYIWGDSGEAKRKTKTKTIVGRASHLTCGTQHIIKT